MKLSRVTTTMLAASVLALGVLGANCSRGGTGGDTASQGVGTVKLGLTAPGGYTINSVNYQVHSSTNAVVSSGTIDVSNPGATVSLDLVLAPGNGYTVTISATSTTGRTFTGTSLPFNVVSGQTTLVSVTLTDSVAPGAQPGTIIVNGTIIPGDNPPVITSVVVAPAQTGVGGIITVSAAASDPDAADVLSFHWTASAGTFANANAAATTYTSNVAGTQTLTITVSDNHSPTAISTFINLPVTIVAVGGTGGAGGAGTGGAGTGGAGTGGANTGGAATGGANTGGAATGGANTGGAATGGANTGGAATGGAATGGAGTGGAGTGGVAVDTYLQLQNAELATGTDPVLLTATYQLDPDTFEPIAIGWGPRTLPTAAEQTAAFALIRRIASLHCSTNSTNTGPGSLAQLGCLLGVNAPLSNAFAGIFADPATSAVNEYKAAAIASHLPPSPGAPGVTAASSNVDFGNAIAAAATDPTTAVGLADNIVKVAIDFSLLSQLAAF